MRYAQYSAGRRLHLVCEPGEEYRGEIVRAGYLSLPLCGINLRKNYRMTINVPLRNACKRCLGVLARDGQEGKDGG